MSQAIMDGISDFLNSGASSAFETIGFVAIFLIIGLLLFETIKN
jgi:hypothetical protein